jgi:guanylate kinase
MPHRGKLIVFSAPSGSGKTTIVRALLENSELNMAFSISATSRAPRGKEIHGKDYYFLSPEAFEKAIKNEEFLEWEEVYPGQYYGTLKSEVDRLRDQGKNVVFDIDVQGGMSIKKAFGPDVLSIFVQPPSVEILAQRLTSRGTESDDKIKLRLDKAHQELSFAPSFDHILVNDQLERAINQAKRLILNHIGQAYEKK